MLKNMNNTVKQYAVNLTKRSWKTFWNLIKVMVPVMIVVRIAQQFGLIEFLSPFLEPLMKLMGLPAEAGIVWLTGTFVGIYASFGALPVLSGLEITSAQLSILCVLILFTHALPVEQAIIKRAGGSLIGTTALRIGTAIIYGIIISWICRLTGFLSEKADVASFRHFTKPANTWSEWALSSASSLVMILIVIFLILMLLDFFDKVGITKWLMDLMAPLLKFSGLDRQTTPVTTIGILLGISFGGALIIQQTKEHNIERRALSLSLCWICLSHALIEDTGLMLALGADIWVLLVGRLIITLFIIKLLAIVLDTISRNRIRRQRA